MRIRAYPKYVQLGICFAIGFLLLFVRLPSAYAWQLGWYTTDSVYDYGAGSDAAVHGGLSCTSCYFVAATQFFDNSSVEHEINMIDESNGTVIGAEMEYIYSGDSCPNNYCDKTFVNGCGSFSTGTFYTQKIYWNSSYDQWWYTNSNCSVAFALVLSFETSSANAQISTSTVSYGYKGTADFMESPDATVGDFASNAAYAEFDTSLLYMASGYTWYSATVWDHQYEASALTGTGAPGVDYYCSTPWEYVASGYGGAWSYGSNPGWAC